MWNDIINVKRSSNFRKSERQEKATRVTSEPQKKSIHLSLSVSISDASSSAPLLILVLRGSA